MLTAADLAAEQAHLRDKSHLHHRRLHGYGTVSGLEVSVADGCVVVSPSLAIDGFGREVVVTEPLTQAGPEDLVLARLTGSRRRAVRVDESVRRPLGPDQSLRRTHGALPTMGWWTSPASSPSPRTPLGWSAR